MRFLLLLTVIGCAVALQSQVEYEYLYKARVGTGLQTGRPQYSTTGIQAKVKVSIENDAEATIKMSEVQVGDANGNVVNNGREEIHMSYQPIHDKSLELPFKAHLKKHDGEVVMEVPENDLLWVTNVRRGVAQLLKIAPLIDPSSVRPSNRDNEMHPQAFSKIEDTYAGRCQVSYSIAPASQQDIHPELSTDIQHENARKGPAGDEIKLAEQHYLLQTSIDFSACSDRVALMQTGAGNLTNVTSSTYRDVASRAYTTQYVLKGEPGKFRIERVQAESHFLYNPFGIDSEKMAVVSNQTLSLLSAAPASRYSGRMQQSARQVHTWRHQLESPNSEPHGYKPRWIEYKKQQHEQPHSPIFFERMASGFGLTEEIKNKIKQSVIEEIKHAAEQLFKQNENVDDGTYGGTKDGLAVQKLDQARRLVRSLPYDQLKQIWESFKQEGHSSQSQHCLGVYREVLSVAASGPSVHLLLEKIQSREINENSTVSIFFNLANNIQSPEVVEKLMQYVMSLNEEQQVVLSLIAKVNFALLARRLCVSQQYKRYSHMQYIFGDKICDKSNVVSQYVPHLEQKITQSSQNWVKILNLLALGDLGAPEGLRTLENVARGEHDEDLFVRMAAIHGMGRRQFDNTTKPQIFNILQPIAESQREDYRIRQVAYNVLLSWRPNATFIQRMALASPTEPSRQMQSYIYWLLTSLSLIDEPHMREVANAARDFLPFTQFMNPSKHRSVTYITSKYLFNERVGDTSVNSWLTSFDGEFPDEIYSYVTGKFGRFNVPLLERAVFGNSRDAYAALRELFEEGSKVKSSSQSTRNPHQRRAEERRQRVSEIISQKMSETEYAPSSSQPDLYYYLKMWSTSEAFLPLTNEFYSLTRQTAARMMQRLKDGEDVVYHKFLNPVEIIVILPTPIGLFSSIELTTPTMLIGNATAKLVPYPPVENPSDLPTLEKVEVRVEGITKIITKCNSYSYIYAPWTNKTLVSAVDNEKSFSLPMKYQMAGEFKLPVQNLWGQIEPKLQQGRGQVPVLKIRNVPFTTVGHGFPATLRNNKIYEDIRPANWSYIPEIRSFTYQIPENLIGMKALIKFNGETKAPFTQSDIYYLFSEPSRLLSLMTTPTIKRYEVELSLDSSSNNKIGFSARRIIKNGNGQPISEDSAKQPADLSADDSLEQRLQKVVSFSDQENNEMSLRLNFTGGDAKQYELSWLCAKDDRNHDQTTKDKVYKLQLSFLEKNSRDSSPNHKPKVCFVAGINRPQVMPMTDIKKLLDEGKVDSLKTTFKADVYEGQNCQSGSSIAEIKGDIHVTEIRARNIIEKIRRSDSTFNGTEEFYRLAAYDYLSAEGSWRQASNLLKNVTMLSRDFAEGYLFPKITKNHYVSNPANRVKITAHRAISDERAVARVELPWEVILAERVNVDPWFDYITAFTNDVYESGNDYGYAKLSATGQKCEITPQQVKTFDAVTFEKQPTTCQSIVSKLKYGQDDILVLTKQTAPSASSEQELHILSSKNGIEIIMKESSVKVNGEEMREQSKVVKNTEGTVFCKIVKVQGMIEATIPGKMTVVLKERNKVQIKLDPKFRSVTRGLCGDFDSESVDDLRSPNQCVFEPSEGKKYAASWVSQKSQCNEPQMKQLFEQYTQAQSTCSRGRRVSGGNCMIRAYYLKEIDQMICVCETQEHVCPRDKSCRNQGSPTSKQLKYKCWSKQTAPEVLKQQLSVGYTLESVSQSPERTVTRRELVPQACRQILSTGAGDPQCYDQGYPVRSTGPLLCISKQQYQVCKPECKVTDTQPQKVESKCWNRDQAPAQVKQSVFPGYSKSPVSQNAQFTSELSVDQPLGCYSD